MIAKTTTTTHLAQMLTQARAGTDALFGLVRPEALYERPVPERHRIIFYFGHLEAFDWNLISQAAAVPSFQPEFDQLFAFGIDPKPGQLPQDKRSDWPGDIRGPTVQPYAFGRPSMMSRTRYRSRCSPSHLSIG